MWAALGCCSRVQSRGNGNGGGGPGGDRFPLVARAAPFLSLHPLPDSVPPLLFSARPPPSSILIICKCLAHASPGLGASRPLPARPAASEVCQAAGDERGASGVRARAWRRRWSRDGKSIHQTGLASPLPFVTRPSSLRVALPTALILKPASLASPTSRTRQNQKEKQTKMALSSRAMGGKVRRALSPQSAGAASDAREPSSAGIPRPRDACIATRLGKRHSGGEMKFFCGRSLARGDISSRLFARAAPLSGRT